MQASLSHIRFRCEIKQRGYRDWRRESRREMPSASTDPGVCIKFFTSGHVESEHHQMILPTRLKTCKQIS